MFKSGIFYIFIYRDAIKISKKYGLKLTNLNRNILKCGFPTNSLDKYMNVFRKIESKIVIVDSFELEESDVNYFKNDKVVKEVNKIRNLDINQISPIESFDILREFKDVIDNE